MTALALAYCGKAVRVQTSRTVVNRLRFADLLPTGSPPAGTECLTPRTILLDGRPDPVLVGLGLERDQTAFMERMVRCRKCAGCLKHRSNLWTARAIDEVAIASRSWFGTLTLSPDKAFYYTLKAGATVQRSRCEPLADLSAQDRFAAIAREVGPELQRWLKRIRTNSGASLRYLLVCEAHKSGVPHFHVLVHEYGEPVRKRTLDGAWRDGFSQFRLVNGDKGAARYVCKYLSKSALTRVRASKNYGKPPALLISEALSAKSRAVGEAGEHRLSKEGPL